MYSKGDPSPAICRILRFIPDEFPIYHWSNLDYGGFNILSQLRCLASDHIQTYRMDIATLDAADRANLKKLLFRLEVKDVREVITHIQERGVKLE